MQPLIILLNQWGVAFVAFASSMLLQATVLMGLLALLDFTIGRRMRASMRYSIWMLLLIKLMLPINFSLPTGLLRFQRANKLVNQSEDRVPATAVFREPGLHLESTGLNSKISSQAFQIERSSVPITGHVVPKTAISFPASLLIAWIAGMLGLVTAIHFSRFEHSRLSVLRKE